ncbi:MAG: aminotransferase class V-fold PLP-dependent enzyme [Gammaproteobacteria bacterium]|nr:aminotransferase class V-fold PLP-dependent enzyme [Gammaproteobacteria bacterium]
MPLDSQIHRMRSETPACKNLIHFNNAGCSLTPKPVLDSVISHLCLEQEIGGYEAAAQADSQIERFYSALAGLLNCAAGEIAFIENATRAWDMAFYSIPFQKGDRILTGQAEYASNYLAMLQVQKLTGIEITVIPSDEKGILCLDRLQQEITDRVKLIALTHIPSQSGIVQPAQAVGEIANKHNIIYLLDVCQSAGQMTLDVNKIGCDILTGTGRKYLRGPRGTGYLYIKNELLDKLEPPFIDLHSASWKSEQEFEWQKNARRFENWECFVAGKIGLARAVEYAMELGLENIENRIQQLARLLISALQAQKNITVFESGDCLSGIITFIKNDEKPLVLQQRLQPENINIGVSKRSSAMLDFSKRGLETINRASLHYYNTEGEINKFIEVLSAK